MNTLNETPSANRVHIGFFGKVNSGKSSLINCLCHQDVSIVSSVAGTTTDPVNKVMEINGIGPCVLIDTPGVNDNSELGNKRLNKTRNIMDKCDIAIVLFNGDDFQDEIKLVNDFKTKNTKVICVISKSDEHVNTNKLMETGLEFVEVSIKNQASIDYLKSEMINQMQDLKQPLLICQDLVKADDVVLLVMPQDPQAPSGRLILPQVQTIRELLDSKCIIVSCVKDNIVKTLNTLSKDPDLIICDSQCFKEVCVVKPKNSKLTSFSILFARLKGDINYFVDSIKAIESLNAFSKVLIAEACSHAPMSEDIGRVQIPRLLKRVNPNLQIDICAGPDFPDDLSKYNLIIHCGACMFNRKYVLNRVNKAKQQKVAMTNYGIVLAYFNGILDKVEY